MTFFIIKNDKTRLLSINFDLLLLNFLNLPEKRLDIFQ